MYYLRIKNNGKTPCLQHMHCLAECKNCYQLLPEENYQQV